MSDQIPTDEMLDTVSAMPENKAESEEEIELEGRVGDYFTGTFAHALDGKGRLVIPLAFRDKIGATFTITPEFDFKSIAVYPNLAYLRMRDKHERKLQEKSNPKHQKYVQMLDALTFRSQEYDGQGRVLLPVRLRQVILGEDKEVDIMGYGDHLRIAVRAKCDEELLEFIGNIDDILENM